MNFEKLHHQSAHIQTRLQLELDTFHGYRNMSSLGDGQFHKIDSYGYIYHPLVNKKIDEFDLLFTALVHGDEYAGVAVLNAIAGLLARNMLQTNMSIGFLLCNVEASKINKRFVDRDMNRTFGRKGYSTLEDARAREVEKHLRSASFCVDFHQTIEPIDHPFFVIGAEVENAKFASSLSKSHPMVSDSIHPPPLEEKEGVRADQYMRKFGVVGIAIELGQKGFDNYQVSEGVALGIEAIATAERRTKGDRLSADQDVTNKIYTWSHTEPFPSGEVSLIPGLKNFQPVERGQQLGTVDGVPIYSPESGVLLFPKYVDSSESCKPEALFKIIREISIEQLYSHSPRPL